MDQVTLRRDGKTLEATGKVLVTAQDGGLLLLARDGVLWLIPPEEQVEHTSDAAPFAPLTRDEMSKRLLAELPQGFRVYPTDALPDLLRYVAGVRAVVRIAVRAAVHGVHQFLDPQGIRADRAGVPAGGHRVCRQADRI